MKQALENAILTCNLMEVKKLLTLDPSAIDLTTDEHIPMAFLAARMGNLPLTRYIVEYSRASMNLRDTQYRNILHYAVLSGKLDTIPYLVEKVGMSAFDGDCNLITPFDLAHSLHFTDIEAYFCAYYHTSYDDTYHNPIRTGMYPDPSIIRVGNDYYMANSSFIFFPCIPVSHSTDLIHWEIIGHAITNPKWANIDELEGGRGYWAPDISYHNGKYYITATYRMNDTGSVIRRQIIVSSDKPEGPYSEPFYIDEDGIDPSLFHDDDGRTYMLLNRGARILEIDLEQKIQVSPASLLFYGAQKRAPEGPHLLKKDGWYYLFLAEGGTGPGHRITVSRSRTLMGNYEPCPYNPIMRQWETDAPIQRCGHGKPVMTQNGEWYMTYLCGRMIDGKYSMLGRETALDPITWTADEWPVVNCLQGPSCQQIKPKLPPLTFSKSQKTPAGFGKASLSRQFMTPRTPSPDGIRLHNGILQLEGSPYDLHSMYAKNILVRRQTDFCFTASVSMNFTNLKAGQDAGITCYYDENTYLKFGVFLEKDRYLVSVFEKIGDREQAAYTKDITNSVLSMDNSRPAHYITLKVETAYLKRSFFYTCPNAETALLGTLEHVYYLCDEGLQKGKRFTGAMVGVYAYAAANPSIISFEDFKYTAK